MWQSMGLCACVWSPGLAVSVNQLSIKLDSLCFWQTSFACVRFMAQSRTTGPSFWQSQCADKKYEHPQQVYAVQSRLLRWRRLRDQDYFYSATACNATHGIAKAFLSVCLSVCQRRALWLNERNLCSHSYTIWKNVFPSFPTRRMVGGDDPLYLKFWAKLTPFEQKRRLPINIRS